MRFFKTCAGGNDFIVLLRLEEDAPDPGPEAVALACRRHLSLGADGLITLGKSAVATARFILRNSDGTAAAFSGNGARCAARVLDAVGWSDEGRVTFETDGGIVAARVLAAPTGALPQVEVEVAPPRDIRRNVPLPPGSPAAAGDFAVVGVPYLAVSVPDVDALDLPRVAPPLRSLAAFPQGANVAFHEPAAAGAPVRLRTFERGVEGETLSSGTGCVMVALALAIQEGALERDGDVVRTFAPRARTPLTVTLSSEGGLVTRVLLAGDARLVAEGTLGDDAFAGLPS